MMKFRGLYYLLIIFLMGNLCALTDLFLHPEIAYFSRDHLIVGGTTAFCTAVLFAFMETSILKEYGKTGAHITSSKIGKRYGWPLAAIWTIIVISSLGWNIVLHKQRTLKIALIEAKTIFEKDLIYYRWATGHHGVFVPVSGTTQPNPYLENISDNEVTTVNGKSLTLINPEYMIRQVYEMQTKQYGPYGHITSLDPIRPENAADGWESAALEAFENGAVEVSSVEEMKGEKYLRLMRPMITETGCLQCHAQQGYELGDIRGGISVSIPMAPLLAISKQDIFTFTTAHVTFWMLGLLGIYLGVQRLSISILGREQAETRVRSIIDNMFDGLITIDEQGNIESCNAAASRIFSYDQQEMVGKHIHLLVTSPDETEESLTQDGFPAEIMEASESPRELLGKRKDGTDFSLEISLSKMVIGENTLFIAMVRDITERNTAKNALFESQTRIIKQEKLASLGTMVAGIAHEINNPAQAISFSMDGLKMNVEYVKDLVEGVNDFLATDPANLAQNRDKLQELVEELDMELVIEGIDGIADRNIQSIDRIDHIVKSTKRMAHSEETFRPCDLNTIVNDAVILTHNQVKYDVDIVTDLATKLPPFQGLAQEMGQVFMNLIMNARDAVKDRGFSKKEGRIKVSTRLNEEKNYIEACFEDNGSGIEEKVIDNIFDPFFTTKAIGSGTGLGLNLCHRIIETHGGDILVDSELGKGTIFTVRLYL
ncbi:MAG: DUF3365 domain-containing protein [Desulfobulbaceae bacterium]|nr:DUF3365 domain-containing protein [Desulfobulbaceae bacterium]